VLRDGISQTDIQSARFEQPHSQVDKFGAPPRVDRTITCIFQHVIEATVETGREFEEVVLQDLDWRIRVVQSFHLIYSRRRKIHRRNLKPVLCKFTRIMPATGTNDDHPARRSFSGSQKTAKYGIRTAQIPAVAPALIVHFPFVYRIDIHHKNWI